MNNEDKILGLLGQLVEKVDKLETGQAEMRSDIGKINGRLDRLETTQAEMKTEQAEMHDLLQKVSVTQEGVVLPQIKLALEGHSELNRKLETLATKEQLQALSDNVDVIKSVVRQHSGDINKLKKAQ